MKKINTWFFVAACLPLLLIASQAHADAGHDHGGAAPVAASNAPSRLPDGSVFLPKNSQRQLALRTVLAQEREAAQTIELTGRVVMDPNAGGRVQPTQPGRIEAGAHGLPRLGQAVRKGQVLAVVRASAPAIERANQQAQAADFRAQLGLAERRVARLLELEGTVPQKEIDAARSDVQGLRGRLAAVGASVTASETLVAPVSGVISASNAVAGQVVDAREILFEIVDPARFVVEAQVFDASILSGVGSASASPASGVGIPLRLLGAGRALREGAIPLQFATSGSSPVALSVNQSVKVLVHMKGTMKGVPLPAAAVVKNAGNQDTVWVHAGAEVFQPRAVKVSPLDGATVLVTEGLKTGDRVVVQGSALVNQVR
ncbi:MAG: HlyD family efflux transporter periplasmic adaptor subunit [Comamonadaceae bacterium]|nr:MAG: HlyD family efflux transporter periplasmic adaptor subunit [Comamonadaceae bacterium]